MKDVAKMSLSEKIFFVIFKIFSFTGVWVLLIYYFVWKDVSRFNHSFNTFSSSRIGEILFIVLFVIAALCTLSIFVKSIIRLFKKNFSWRHVFIYFKRNQKYKGWSKEEIENHSKRANEIYESKFSESRPYNPDIK